MPHLTVQESMMVSANLHLKNVLTTEEKKKIIDDILSVLGLTATTKTMLSEISGGQRKRLVRPLDTMLTLTINSHVLYVTPMVLTPVLSGHSALNKFKKI